MFATIQSLWRLMHGHRARYGAAVAALVAGSCLLYLAPLVPQVVIDGVLSGEPGERSSFVLGAVEFLGGADYVRANLWVPAGIVVLLTAGAGAFTYVRSRMSSIATQAVIRRLRDRLYDHLQHVPVEYYDTVETGDVVQRCTSDVETVRTFLDSHVVEIGRALIMLIVPLPLMLAIDGRMTVAATVLIPVIVVFSGVFFVRVRSSFTDADEAEGRMTATLQENLTGIRVVRAFARQRFERDRFGGRAAHYRDRDYRVYRLMAWYWSLTDLLCYAQTAIVVGLGVYWIAIGELAVGAFYYFFTAVTMFVYPLRMMGRVVTDLGKTVVALGRLQTIFDQSAEPATEADPPSDTDLAPADVRFEGVGLTYPDGTDAIHDVSFRIEPGQTVALVGASGSGKSTLIQLLLRLRDPTHGRIVVDGTSLADVDRKAVRREIAVVMQEPFLYSKTVGANIGLGRAGADDADIRHAAELACVHGSIEGFEHGYDTIVGERGVTLSGGQRQRVALARALLRRPKLLVLDDALSAVDTATESAILDTLRTRHGRHSTLLIAHRLTTVALADHIVVLDHGRVVQSGDHDTLIETSGPYARLWAIQRADSPSDERRRHG